MLTDFKSGFGMVNWNPSGCIADWYRFASGYWYRLDIRIAFRLPTFLNFAPQLLDLIVTIPDTSPDVCVFPFRIHDKSGEGAFFGCALQWIQHLLDPLHVVHLPHPGGGQEQEAHQRLRTGDNHQGTQFMVTLYLCISSPSWSGSMVWIMSWSSPCLKWLPECRTGMLVALPRGFSPATTPDIAAPVTPA